MEKINQDYDSPWKDILEAYFQEFMAFFFPLIENDLNWEKGYKFLDKEFQGIVKEAEMGKRYLDKLRNVDELTSASRHTASAQFVKVHLGRAWLLRGRFRGVSLYEKRI